MLVTVLKAFPYSANGIVTLHLTPSDKDPPEPVEVRDDLVTGLAAEGFIALEGFAHVQPAQTEAAPAADGAQAWPAEVVATDSEPSVAPITAPVDIPADWKAKHWKQRVALAKSLGWVHGDPTTEQADGWITDVIEHRRREEPQAVLGGLSIRETHDALTKAGVEWAAETTLEDIAALLDTAKGLAGDGAGE